MDNLQGFWWGGSFERNGAAAIVDGRLPRDVPATTIRERELFTTDEKLSAGPRGIRLPMFLPFFADDTQAETPAMRRAYRQMLNDDNVKAALLGKVFGVSSLDCQVHPSDKKSERALYIAEFSEWALTRRLKGGIPALFWSIFSGGLVDGYSIVEPVWGVQERGQYQYKWVVREAKAKDVGRTLVPVLDEFRNIVALQGLQYNAGDFFDPSDFLIYSHLPMYSIPGGSSDLRAAYKIWWIYDAALKILASGLDKRTFPMLLGEYPRSDLKPTVEQALEAAKWSNWISVPMGVKVTVIDLAQQGIDRVREALKDLSEHIFLGIAGATLQQLTGQKGAERGDSEVQQDTASLFKWALKVAFESLMNDEESGLLPRLTEKNFRDADPPFATLGGVDEGDYKEMIVVDQTLHAMGVDLSKDQLRETYSRKPPTDDNDRLPGQAAPQPGQPGANGASSGLPFREPVGGPAATPFRERRSSWGYRYAG